MRRNRSDIILIQRFDQEFTRLVPAN